MASTKLATILTEWHPAPEVGGHSEAADSVERLALSSLEPSQQQNQDADSASLDHQSLMVASLNSSQLVASPAVSPKQTLPHCHQQVDLPAVSLKPTLLLHLSPCSRIHSPRQDSQSSPRVPPAHANGHPQTGMVVTIEKPQGNDCETSVAQMLHDHDTVVLAIPACVPQGLDAE